MSNFNDNPMQPTAIPQGSNPTITAEPEVVFYQGNPKLKGEFLLLTKSIAAALVLAMLAFLVFRFEWLGSYTLITGLILVGLALIVLLFPAMWVKRFRYRITNYRIDFETGLIGKSIDSTEINRVHDVQFNQSILDRIVGVGTITLHSSDATSPTLQLRSLPEPRKLYDMLKRRVDEVKVKQRVLRVDNV